MREFALLRSLHPSTGPFSMLFSYARFRALNFNGFNMVQKRVGTAHARPVPCSATNGLLTA